MNGGPRDADRTIDPQTVVDHWDRIGQFYASLESGHTTASVALQRLVSCTAKNHFYRAAAIAREQALRLNATSDRQGVHHFSRPSNSKNHFFRPKKSR